MHPAKIDLYSIFHLNLNYSSIEVAQREDVISRCYWPLLNLVESSKAPVGIELSGYTLELINELNPQWISQLTALIAHKHIELIGSGYHQIIGPLVPSKLNHANLYHGNRVYKELLACTPTIALVNEQAFSSSLIPLYLEAGYQCLVMEWNNSASANSDWNPKWRYFPQQAITHNGDTIDVLWSDSITFQQTQRYIHGENNREKYLTYIKKHLGTQSHTLCIYSSDAEIFDFRPGRFHDEAFLAQSLNEWEKLKKLFMDLQENPNFKFFLPSQILNKYQKKRHPHKLLLAKASLPVPVKKQGKYNLLRWAVSGRDDLKINTACWKFFHSIHTKEVSDFVWRDLCYLWASDFRTHITEKRWQLYQAHLKSMLPKIIYRNDNVLKTPSVITQKNQYRVSSKDQLIHCENTHLDIEINPSRGLSIYKIRFKCLGELFALGTIPHGFYDRIDYVADWYTGHYTYETIAKHKLTDLSETKYTTRALQNGIEFAACIDNELGQINKRIQLLENEVTLEYHFNLEIDSPGVLRCAYMSFFPDFFDMPSLYIEVFNGGDVPDRFAINQAVDHGAPISHLVSARTGFGDTKGEIRIGDKNKSIRFNTDKSQCASIPMLKFEPIGESYFLRLFYSLQEMDDTSVNQGRKKIVTDFSVTITVGDDHCSQTGS